MSYILQGSGTILGPCLAHLVGREVTKCSACICLKCSRLISSVPERGKFLPFPVQSSPTDPSSSPSQIFPQLQQPVVRGDLTPLPKKYPSSALFREKYYTNFATSLPHLGYPNPVNINMSFSVGPELSTGLSYRFLHTTPILEKKSSSKIEDTVTRLKERQNEALAEFSKVEDLEKKIASVIEAEDLAVKVNIEAAKKASPDQRTIWDKVVAEAKHFYSGFKLLFLDVAVSSKIIWRIAQGKTLSRRENRQLVRTVSDLFRLVPFSVFIIIPFMELLLPVALKLFPGMLPSTFASQDQRENKMRRALKAKLEYARFLQKTLDEMGPMDKGHRSQSASDFVHFYNSVKKTGAVENQVTNKDILKFSKLFEDEITLDNMTRGQLVAICRLLELTPIGTNSFLRFQIEMQLRKLKADDVIIAKEGVEQMTVGELQNACKERGMRALGITQEKLMKQLKQWIELSTNEKVPPSLLLLSRTLYLPESMAPEKAIEASISALPEAVATGAKAKIGEREGKIENVTRLEIIKQEQAKIEEEQREQEKNVELKKKKAEEERLKKEKLAQQALEKAIEEQSLGVPPPSPPTTESVVREATSILRRATVSQEGEVSLSSEESNPITFIDTVQTTTDDIHVGRAEVIQKSAPKTAKKSLLEQELSVEDLKALRSAIETITLEKGKTYIGEHEVLSELKQEMVDYDEDLGEMKEVAESTGRKNLRQTKGAARLFKKVNNILGKADTVVSQLKMREEKLRGDIDSLGKVGESSEDQEEHLVTVQDLLGAVRGLQEVPDSKMLERISEVVASMDEDSDGIVKLEHVNKVIEILGSDNVELSGKQVKQIIDLIGKEEMLEVESRIEKILGKMPIMEIKSDAPKQADLKPVIEKDITEKDGDEELKDMAVEMNTDKVEEHIAEMFSRPVGEKKEETKVETFAEPEEENVQIMSRFMEDNSVKDLNESIRDKEEAPEKVPQKNGSK
eukprot:TRINITY_DN5966_c0_g1_i1.p1 TRINITY_DN5966_c0_g1~~TRINITY_DN5966_c0_g1_i1.p1  ORF type:complete len:969 (-),score=376.28 TRINITY_DN5966_c0_g1_i1:129-3035(-)